MLDNPKRKSVFLFSTLVIISALVASIITSAPAFATLYESQQAIKTFHQTENYAIAGVSGTLTITSPLISSVGLSADHRDYVVYVNFYTSSSAMGAGWMAFKTTSGGSVEKWDLVYYRTPTFGTAHNLVNTIPATTSTINAYVEQKTNSASDCWKAGSYLQFFELCLPSNSHPAGNAGSIARALKDYTTSNTMPEKFDYLKWGRWNSAGTLVEYTYFSNDDYLNEYKCYSRDKSNTTSYVLDQVLSRMSPADPTKIDQVGSGPGTYTVDDCVDTSDNQAWTLIGST